MSGISSVNSSTADSGTLGDVAPISFPGIASGIDYNSIIEKLTSLTLAQNKPLEATLTSLNNANTELLKIKNLIANVQNAVSSLSDPSLFNQYSATSSDPSVATAAQISGQVPSAGTTTILSQTLATSTSISSDPTANTPVTGTDTLGSGLFQVTPQYGTNGQAILTIDGHQIIASQSTTINSILTQLNAIPGVTATFTNDQLTITSTGPLSVGSASDTGNLAQVLKIDTAPIVSTTTSATGGLTSGNTLGSYGVGSGSFTINGQTVTYTAAETVGQLISAISSLPGTSASLNAGNNLQIQTTTGSLAIAGDTGNLVATLGLNGAVTQSVSSTSGLGGFSLVTPLTKYGITGNTFTINGVAISINPASDGLTDVINRINASTAGVIATFNPSSGTIQLVSKATGPQGIVLGSPTDNSNFLAQVGLNGGGFNPTIQVGQQAAVTFLNQSGNQQTIYSNSNTITTVLPGLNLTLNSATNTPYTVQVQSDSSGLQSAIGNFVTAYNAAINEINTATAPPIVQAPTAGNLITSGQSLSTQVTSGGPLYDNLSVQNLKDQLVNLTTSLFQTGSSSFNSLASIGLQLDNSVSQISTTSTQGNTQTADSSSADADSGLSVQTFDGTTGQFQALDTTTFSTALQNDPTAVQSLFVGANSLSQQLGAYMTYVTGTPTQIGGTNGSYAAQVPDTSLIQSIENSNSAQISSVNQQIQLVQQSANQQADTLRQEFTASEATIAELQSEQQQLAGFFGTSTSSSSA